MSPRDIQARSAAKPGSLYYDFPSKLAIAEVALGEVAAEEIARLEEVANWDGIRRPVALDLAVDVRGQANEGPEPDACCQLRA